VSDPARKGTPSCPLLSCTVLPLGGLFLKLRLPFLLRSSLARFNSRGRFFFFFLLALDSLEPSGVVLHKSALRYPDPFFFSAC